MKILRALLVLFVITFVGLWGCVYWKLRPFPKGMGTQSLSPDQQWTAVLIPVERAGIRDALRHILDPRVQTLPTQSEVKVHVVKGIWGTGDLPDLYNESLPARHCPPLPLNANEIFHWRQEVSSLDVILRGTNLTIALPDST